jgi:hypothetical protein
MKRYRKTDCVVTVRRRMTPDSAATPNCAPRGGFTIFELLIILALLVTVVAVSWPALQQFSLQYQLRQAGALVQARMTGARVHAIDTGVDYQFRFEPGGQRFIVLPFDTQALAESSASASSSSSSGNSASRHFPKLGGRLPSPKARFDPASTGAHSPQQVPGEWLAGMRDADQYSGVTWSAPILFHADGAASAAHVVIRDNKSRSVTVSIRALTGGVSVSPIVNGGTR